LRSAPVRCKREQWYLARGFPADGAVEDRADLLLDFLRDDEIVRRQRVPLSAVAQAERGEALLGWIQAPDEATHLQVCLPESGAAKRFERLVLHPVAERDPKCHPLANVPRWSTYRPAFPIERVVLPASLELLTTRLKGVEVEAVGTPGSWRKLAAKVHGAACAIDGEWVRKLDLGLSDLERLAARSWLIVDLETFSVLMSRAAARTKTVTRRSEHEIMSARVEYADVPTRGFALQDVFPYAALAEETGFQTRVLIANGAWKRYADETGFATLLSSETPWVKKCGDVLSAARPIDQGELIVTDLPWLAAGWQGRLLAPHLAEHLLRMHLGCPLADCVQYWNRWEDCRVVVRDIGELPRRYPPLRAVRWAAEREGVARLGITLPAEAGAGAARHLLICTGRIDQRSQHDGMPPEPMAIFMRWLVREARERTGWARRFLGDTTITWQFDSGDGLKYAVHFDSAAGIATDASVRTLILKTDGGGPTSEAPARDDGAVQVLRLPADAGVFGDRSLIYQADLTRRLRNWIEQASG
jgi:hypothetical protein